MPKYWASAGFPVLALAALLTACSPATSNQTPSQPARPVSSATPIKTGDLVTQLQTPCPDDDKRQGCLKKGVVDAVDTYGPERATEALTALREKGILTPNQDYHDLAHRIGRETAKVFGITTDAFFHCPPEFNYGCQHGFFEQALLADPDVQKVATRICDPKEMEGMPAKTFFYCYHGVGHGVMMAKAYALQDSLNICDSLDSHAATEGCWQGVFMENVNGVMQGAARSNVFSETDLLAPCDKVADKYQWECYINHSGYLVGKTGFSIEKSTQECLKAAEPGRTACLQSIGLMSTNPGWQQTMLGTAFNKSASMLKNAVTFCHKFPSGSTESCVKAAVDNLTNFDRTDTTRTKEFCGLIDKKDKVLCYAQMVGAVRNELPQGAPTATICAGIPVEYSGPCTAAFPS